jgi:hypothetical protein|tara:strand:- start:526 stop:633 length:108 start_codon:yes stop_codon:yes gene_type:complete
LVVVQVVETSKVVAVVQVVLKYLIVFLLVQTQLIQ